MNAVKNTTILYIDDDPDDIALLQDAVLSIDPNYQLLKAGDGREGLQKLQEMKEAHSLPCLVVLDINMPGMDGRETFVKMKADNVLATIPVVVFSTSSSSMDKLFFQGKKVAYITKPIQYNRLLEVARSLLLYCEEGQERA